jgi:hypothetical protein
VALLEENDRFISVAGEGGEAAAEADCDQQAPSRVNNRTLSRPREEKAQYKALITLMASVL